jgi:hypothetical protein
MWQNRMAGQQYETFNDLLKHVKDLVGDRTLAAMRTKPASHHQGPQPMDIGQVVDDPNLDLNAMYGYKGKGKGKTGWGQPSWEQPQKGEKGKSKGKGKAKGDKGKGKGKDIQCWTCSGWGHRSNQCPSEHQGGGKGVNEVGEGPQTEPSEPSSPEEQEEEEEPAWLGIIEDAPQILTKVEKKEKKKKKISWSPMVVNYNRNPTTTTTAPTKTATSSALEQEKGRRHPWTSSPGGFHARSRATGRSPSWEDYNQFSLLEDADEESEDGDEEIMVVTEPSSTSRWTKISAIIDSGAVEHVLPERWLPCIKMEESPGSKAGKKYLSATGQEIPNLGQKAIVGKTREGQARGIVFQVAPVRKPLMSVAKMNEAGNDVNLTGARPHILNTKTKQITDLRREGKTFILDLWVKHPGADNDLRTATRPEVISRASGFSRRG